MNIRHRLERAEKIVEGLSSAPPSERRYLIMYATEEAALAEKKLKNVSDTNVSACCRLLDEEGVLSCGRHSGPNGEWVTDFTGSQEAFIQYCRRCRTEQRTRLLTLYQTLAGLEPAEVCPGLA